MNKPDIATIIDLHFEELTELEQEIARYFLQAETIQDDLSSQQVTQKLHISQAALTRFAKKCGFTGYREFVFQYQHQASKPDTHSHKHRSFDQTCFTKLQYHERTNTGFNRRRTTGTRRPINR